MQIVGSCLETYMALDAPCRFLYAIAVTSNAITYDETELKIIKYTFTFLNFVDITVSHTTISFSFLSLSSCMIVNNRWIPNTETTFKVHKIFY